MANLMFDEVLASLWALVQPNLGWIVLAVAVWAVVFIPPFGRGASGGRRDVWRGFRFGARAKVFARAGGRCEASTFLVWGRCIEAATEADHIFPWSRGGATVVSNGQALCREHNRNKSALRPPWWYVLGLERRRKGYFPEGEQTRVYGLMSKEEASARRR